MEKWAAIHSGPYLTPTVALESYSWAALVMGKNAPRCQIGWTTIAAIGRLTTDHGTADRRTLGENAIVSPKIRRTSTPAAKDTDGGYYDGNTIEDAKMGPLLFSPTVWEQWAITASKDTKVPPNPDNLDDAALTLARMLCGAGADMSTPEGWQKAVSTYNDDPRFLEAVNLQAKSYGA
jgi:membrane-bound lytic murein transglycosylase B